MLPYDWETDPWNWLEQRTEYSCLRVDYSLLDRDRIYGERQRPSLRLVRIEPSAAQDPLRCSLTLLNSKSLVAEGPNEEKDILYEAVSYVWGCTDDPVPLRCKTDELEVDYSYNWIAVTKNCAEVFRHLRLLNQTRYVWIDAISIDQADTADRAHYVRQMHHIYRDAERVIVVLPNYKKESGEYWAESKPGAWIFTHPYFTRIWILQEVFWGRNPVVYAGHHELQWSEVCSLYYTKLKGGILLSKETQISVELVLAMGKSTSKSASGDNKWRSLLELYQMSKSFGATDQQDKLIALISMATDVSPQMEAILVDYTVAHDVLLRRFAAGICFRSLNIMPGVERGIETSQTHLSHNALQSCTDKIEKFMTLSTPELPDIIKTLSFRSAERYIWSVEGNGPSFRSSLSNALKERLSFRHPLNSMKVISLCVWTVGIVAYFGIDRLEGRRRFSGSQSKKMTVSELLDIIEKSRALVNALHSDDQAFSQLRHKKDWIRIPTASRNKRIEDKTTVRAAILGYEPFDLCLVHGDVNGLQSRCKRALVKFSYDAGVSQRPPVPLLLQTRPGRQRVLGPFYDFEPTHAQSYPGCCKVPIVEQGDSKSPEAISILNHDELKLKMADWMDSI